MLWWLSGRGEGVWTPLLASNAVFRGGGRGIGGDTLELQLIIEVKFKMEKLPSTHQTLFSLAPSTRLPRSHLNIAFVHPSIAFS